LRTRAFRREIALAKRPWPIAPFNSALKFAEVEDVAQLSRPFQIALGAVVLFALVWMLALRAHVSNPSGSTSTNAPAVVASGTKGAKGVAAVHRSADPSSSVHKTGAVVHETASRSHKTVASVHKATFDSTKRAASTRHAASVRQKTVTRPKTVTPSPKTATLAPRAVSPPHKTVVLSGDHTNTLPSNRSDSSATKHGKRPVEQVAVEHELAQGKTVMLVFWNPKSSVDREVQSQAGALAGGSKGTVTMHAALASQVGLFGSITEVAHVYQTPTILIVNRHGVVSTITGLTDVFALEQAVREAQRAAQ
jgi:hypothetical protein